MTISQVVMSSLAIMGKADSDNDYAAVKANALEVLEIWSISAKKLYLAYAEKNSIEPNLFTAYGLNDEFAYGEDFAPAAAFYIASVLVPSTELFKQMYDNILSDMCSYYGSTSSVTVNKYAV